ncbi:MAG: type II/IV secretion system ATPase subunit [Candidatus Thermoplasmatota archaeon]|nr:type II/IV secretion system ATPase subunit [Candidatus Thermoplasmatota archaeon]
MGLLEKVQQKKSDSESSEEITVTIKKKHHRSTPRKTTERVQKKAPSISKEPFRIETAEQLPEQPRIPVEKIRQVKTIHEEPEELEQHTGALESVPAPPEPEEQTQDEDTDELLTEEKEKQIEIIEEQTGFGWKQQGKKQIVYDHTTHEFLFQVIEPPLNEDQMQTKEEIAHLFKMLADIDTFDMTFEEKEKFLEETIEHIILDNHIYIEEGSKDIIYYHIFRDFLGYGRIDILMHDDGIEDISVDGPSTPVFIHHRKYEAIETNIYFDSEQELNSFLVRLCQISGKQISIFSPIVDGKLPDGSRLQATLARTVTKGSTFTIRKFKEIPLTPIDLIEYKSMSTEMAAYFWMAIEDGASILFCGGTASGKTTALNALMLFIPSSHKIISIEDTREVNIPHKNWIAGTTRKGFSASDENKTGKDIDMFDLIRAALRQRPRVIIVGEVRGKEAYSLFQAMATGHTAYATVHASTIHTLIQRLENPPIELPRALLTSLDVIVFQNAVDIGGKMVRRMTSVTEIIKLDSDTNQLIFMAPYTWVSKTDDRFEAAGQSKILNRIKQQNDWSDEQLIQEINNRMLVLEWMRKKKIKSYKKFGSIIAEYKKFPDRVLELAKRELEE